jgi:hypothetical protein
MIDLVRGLVADHMQVPIVLHAGYGRPPSSGRRYRSSRCRSRDVVGGHFAWTEQLCSSGGPPLARVAELILRCALISTYTALARGVDPTPVAAIDDLWAVLA